MYVLALATDYDETLADGGVVRAPTLAALRRFKDSGRRLILVTGRELPDLKAVFPALALFDRVVAENGALLYTPASEAERSLAPGPSMELVARLKAAGVTPLSVGRTVIATREPFEQAVLEAVRALGLELEIIFNKGAVMVLPSGVNKATGLRAALEDLGLSEHNVAGIGDAENDHAFLAACGCPAAVANALPSLKQKAHLVTKQARGAGVAELVSRILKEDGAIMPAGRVGVVVGEAQGRSAALAASGASVLIAGQSGAGKSTFATAITESMREREFQFCVFDPQGDYQELAGAVTLGDAMTPPTAEAVIELLHQTRENVVVNTVALEAPERPAFLGSLLPPILAMRARVGRPHWLIIGQAHRLLPAEGVERARVMPETFRATIFVTAHPERISRLALRSVDTVIALGPHAPDVISKFCAAIEIPAPKPPPPPGEDEVLFWQPSKAPPLTIRAKPRRQTRQRGNDAQGTPAQAAIRGGSAPRPAKP